MKTCIKCNHFVRAEPYKWGSCAAPLPAWVYDIEYGPRADTVGIGPTNIAGDCDLYEEKPE